MEISDKDLQKMVDSLTVIQQAAFRVYEESYPVSMGTTKIQSECEKMKLIILHYLNH